MPRLGSPVRVRFPALVIWGRQPQLSAPVAFLAPWPSGKAEDCKSFIPGSNPGGASRNTKGFGGVSPEALWHFRRVGGRAVDGMDSIPAYSRILHGVHLAALSGGAGVSVCRPRTRASSPRTQHASHGNVDPDRRRLNIRAPCRSAARVPLCGTAAPRPQGPVYSYASFQDH